MDPCWAAGCRASAVQTPVVACISQTDLLTQLAVLLHGHLLDVLGRVLTGATFGFHRAYRRITGWSDTSLCVTCRLKGFLGRVRHLLALGLDDLDALLDLFSAVARDEVAQLR